MLAISPALLTFFNTRPRQMLCAELFTITLLDGPYQAAGQAPVLRYTTSMFPVNIGGLTWSPGPPNFARGTINVETGTQSNGTTIGLTYDPRTMFGGTTLSAAIARGDWDYATILQERAYSAGVGQPWVDKLPRFLGLISDIAKIGETSATLDCKDMLHLLDAQFPRNVLQASCNKIFGQEDCGENPLNNQVAGTVVTAGLTSIAASGALRTIDGFYQGGTLTFTSGQLSGVSYPVKAYVASGMAISLDYPMLTYPAAGDQFTIRPSCDHTLATCTTRYANEKNFGGYPYIPQPEILY